MTLSVESDVPFEGFSPYIVIKGVARVEVGGAVPCSAALRTVSFLHPVAIARGIRDAHHAAAALRDRPVGSRRVRQPRVRVALFAVTSRPIVRDETAAGGLGQQLPPESVTSTVA